ncbi:MAG: thioredoxin [Coriobacteriales bacterium]|jgi:thioredoxin 1|nr:thioredoxin [Coriobacteriales bacterium]MDO5708681.1 thioredoxin [Coriobacteriales bacterium]
MAEAITTATFDDVIANSDKPVLVDFWATWCGPCRALGPIVEQVGNEMADRLAVYKCDVDSEGDLAQRFRIVSIPTLILFKGGEAVHTMVGSMPKADLVAEIEAHL